MANGHIPEEPILMAEWSYYFNEKGYSRTKFNTIMEKNIESMWRQAQGMGLSDNEFFVCLSEILAVLIHRNSATTAMRPKEQGWIAIAD